MTWIALEVERKAARTGNILAGKYRLGRLLDQSGLECAYLAVNEDTDLQVVVKLLRPEWQGDRERTKKFHEEAALAARIKHPNIASVLDAGAIDDDALFVVLEHAQGITLRRFVALEQPVPVERIGRIMEQVVGAIAALHRHQINHGGVGSANVLIQTTRDWPDQVKLIDFDPTRRMDNEQFPRTAESDLLGAGKVLRELLTGHAHPTVLEPVALRALAHDPGVRFRTAREMLDALAIAMR